MKTLRIAGLILILLAALGGAVNTAQATAPVTCWKICDNIYYSGSCWLTLAQCCNTNTRCPRPYVYQDGNCTDGMNYCP